MKIELLENVEDAPMNLLLLADPSRKLVESYLAEGKCYIAKEGRDTVGVYVLLPRSSSVIELVNVAVKDSMQGKGIGKSLVLHAVREARRQGYQVMELGTGNSSIGQLALYQKCGFRIVGVRKNFFTNHYSEAIVENGIVCRDMIRLEKDLLKEDEE